MYVYKRLQTDGQKQVIINLCGRFQMFVVFFFWNAWLIRKSSQIVKFETDEHTRNKSFHLNCNNFFSKTFFVRITTLYIYNWFPFRTYLQNCIFGSFKHLDVELTNNHSSWLFLPLINFVINLITVFYDRSEIELSMMQYVLCHGIIIARHQFRNILR